MMNTLLWAAWLALSTPLFLSLHTHIFAVTMVRVGYLIVSVLFLYATIRREMNVSHRRHEYEQLLHAMVEPVLIHDHGTILDLNEAASNFFRASSASELVGHSILHFIHADDIEKAEARLRRVSKGKPTELTDMQFVTCGGVVRDVEASSIPVTIDHRPVTLLFIRDISERKANEVALRMATQKLVESEQRYRSLFENDADMIVSVDSNGIIQTANPACEQTLGYAPNELIGRHYREFLAPAYRLGAQSRFQQIFRGQLQSLFVKVVHRSGELIDVYEKKVPIVANDEVTGFFWIVRDITNQRVAEERMIASERLSAVGQLAAGIAHEIRNPLTAIKGFVQLMMKTQHVDLSHLAIMESELERIALIINELLVFSKPATPEMKRVHCGALLSEVTELMNSHANMKNIVIERNIHVGDAEINCDQNRLKQVLVNVIKNAIEAVDADGFIELGARLENDETALIYVRDTGPGIPEAVLRRVGEPFFTTKTNGTGLGLMVCRKIIDGHNGVFRIVSELGKGTLIEVVLPVLPPEVKEPDVRKLS